MPASKALTPRKFVTYIAVLAVVVFADPWQPTFIAGCVLAAIGVFFRVWGCGHLEKNKKLVTTGPYAYVKNPLYLGSFLVSIGGLLAAGNPSGKGLYVWVALVPLFALAFFLFYLPRKFSVEGNRLERKFGEDFDRFDKAVPDFVPRLTPYRSGDPQRWGWHRFIKNHEIGMDLLIAGLFVLLWFGPALLDPYLPL